MLFTQFELPNGSTLNNRIVKAAMEESMAEPNRAPGKTMLALYKRWSKGGSGLLITGNVMIDGRHMTGPGGLVLEDDRQLASFKQWASQAKSGGNQVWMQINHPGRQAPSKLNEFSYAPSTVNLDMGKYSKMFAPARAMTNDDIENVIERFVTTAKLAEEAGFDGVEIHAAHGYLISQFLSPLVNKRKDEWGGSIENRARLLLRVVEKVRAAVKPNFAVAVKLNSADFQRGGFEPEDALAVIKMLETHGIDLVELSGGSYEAPAMQGNSRDSRSLAREAYFLEFAQSIAKETTLPVMTTGGISRQSVAENVLAQGVDLVGIATGLALVPDLPKRWQQQPNLAPRLNNISWSSKTLVLMARMAQVREMMRKHANSHQTKAQAPYWLALLRDQWLEARSTKAFRRWHSVNQ